ncbi:MAG: hypothetical protein OXI20_10430 [Rhodospirillales bacterium]|nr:hypothetical protein [Rhodospirillales bacterium]
MADAAEVATVAGRITGKILGVSGLPDSDMTAAATAALDYIGDLSLARNIPDSIRLEAAVRYAGWMIGNNPHVTRRKSADPSGSSFELDYHAAATSNGFRSSGASALLSRYAVRRGGIIGGDD